MLLTDDVSCEAWAEGQPAGWKALVDRQLEEFRESGSKCLDQSTEIADDIASRSGQLSAMASLSLLVQHLHDCLQDRFILSPILCFELTLLLSYKLLTP